MIKSSFGFPVNGHRLSEKPPSSSSSSSSSSTTTSVHNILFVRREDYLAHPRHDGKVQSRLINEEEVFDSLHHCVTFGSISLTKCGIKLVNGLFAHMSMERSSPSCPRRFSDHRSSRCGIDSHCVCIPKWKDLEYHAMHLANSRADPTTVVEKLKEIMKSAGC